MDLETPTFENHIQTVIDRSKCVEHDSPRQEPCYYIETIAGDILSAVCGRRAKNAGFNGKISPQAMNSKRSDHGKRS